MHDGERERERQRERETERRGGRLSKKETKMPKIGTEMSVVFIVYAAVTSQLFRIDWNGCLLMCGVFLFVSKSI